MGEPAVGEVPTGADVVQVLDAPMLLGVTAVDAGELSELGWVDVYPGLVGNPGVEDLYDGEEPAWYGMVVADGGAVVVVFPTLGPALPGSVDVEVWAIAGPANPTTASASKDVRIFTSLPPFYALKN